MQRLLCISVILGLSGCATYTADPEGSYADRTYDRYRDRYDTRWDPWSRGYGYSVWYYDLYDPYSAMFHPFGYLYDPWSWDRWRFGVHRYPSRYWSFNFYGGRPWYYSPWYGGYALYYPYGYRIHRPAAVRGVPVVVHTPNVNGETAATAARGLAAEVHRSSAQALELVRTNAVRVSPEPGHATELLGTMAIPGARMHGLPAAAGYPQAAPATLPGLPAQGRETHARHPRPRYDAEAGLPLDRAGFRSLPARHESGAPQVHGLPAAASAGWEPRAIAVPIQPARLGLPDVGGDAGAGATLHPWQDRRGNAPAARGHDRPYGLPGMGAHPAQHRSLPSPAPSGPTLRSESAGARSTHGLRGGAREARDSSAD